MLRLAAVVFIMVGSVLAGACVIAMLSLGRVDAVSIALAALVGAVLAMPVAWVIAGKLNKAIRPA